jgi:hypothetical protein
MTEPIDAQIAAVELTAYLDAALHPKAPQKMQRAKAILGTRMSGAIIGALIFKAILRDAGYAIVPLAPTPDMVSAFKRNWFRKFCDRYAAMVRAAWPDGP